MRKIRRYAERDFVDYVETLEKTSSWKKKAGSELKARLERLTNREQVWVAEVDLRGVGFMIVSPNGDDSLEISWLDVHPSFQRMGVGSALIDKAEKTARAKGFHALSIHSSYKNSQMVGCAEKNRFFVFERLKNFYGRGKDALHMIRRLSS